MLAAFVAVLVVFVLTPYAEASPVFRVDGVIGDVTAENVVIARDKAFAEASANALRTLYQRLARAHDVGRLPEPTPELAESLTSVFQVVQEHATLVRYRLLARVTFDPNAVTALFRRNGVVAYSDPSPPVLIVPVLESGSVPTAFTDTGDWFQAWHRIAPEKSGLVPIEVALGTNEDRMEPLERIRAGDRISLDALRLRYSAQGVVLAVARQTPGRAGVSIQLEGHNGGGSISDSFEIEAGMDAAALETRRRLEEAWKASLARGGYLSAGAGRTVPVQQLDPQPRRRQFSRTLRSGVRVRGEQAYTLPFDPVGGSR
ncbi:MAG: DUF2066 domain-containing protein [Pseudomonadota bacterium]